MNKYVREFILLLMVFSFSICLAEDEPGISIKALASATYFGIYDAPIALKDGRWEGEPFVEGGASRPTVGLVDDFHLKGDLDGDGLEELAVILWENSGGSGVNNYIAIMSQQDGKIVNLGTALIGDRVQIQSGRIENGKVELNVIQQGEKDAACCPTEKVTRSWTLGGLLEQQSKRM